MSNVITNYTRWCEAFGPLSKDQMDVTKGCFGLRRVSRQKTHDIIEIFIEDDGLYHFNMSFSEYWVTALINLLAE